MALTNDSGWIKSSFSNGSGGNNCIEIRRVGDKIMVRDSKNPEVAPLVFTPAEWDAFVSGVEAGEFANL